MGRRSRGRRLHLNAEINVVSLIDVILLLLIIFMITAPMMTGGLNLDLPEANTQPTDNSRAIVLSIERSGRFLVDGKEWDEQQFRSAFRSYYDQKGKPDVTIYGDTTMTYGKTIMILDVLGEAGVKSTGLAAIPRIPPR